MIFSDPCTTLKMCLGSLSIFREPPRYAPSVNNTLMRQKIHRCRSILRIKPWSKSIDIQKTIDTKKADETTQ
jgi:hypothetical protein